MMGYMGGPFFWIITLIIIFLLIYMFKDRYDSGKDKETPLDILKRRFANGNISEEEYISKKESLSK